jgi:hypothetical protein
MPREVATTVQAYEHAEQARRDLGLSVDALWVAYLALGGFGTAPQLSRYLADGTGFTAVQHDYVAQALNDAYVDVGANHPVPYWDSFKGNC